MMLNQDKNTRLQVCSIYPGDEKPAKVDILIFDSPFAGGSESGNIYKQTVTV